LLTGEGKLFKHLEFFSVKLSAEDVDDVLDESIKLLVVNAPKLQTLRFLINDKETHDKLQLMDIGGFCSKFAGLHFRFLTYSTHFSVHIVAAH